MLVNMKQENKIGDKLTQTSLVVHIGISKVEVPMSFSVIEFHSDGMVRLLIHRPHSSS